MLDRKTEIHEIIASGVRLTQQQDDDAYALFTPEEYYAISDDQKPRPDDIMEKLNSIEGMLQQLLSNPSKQAQPAPPGTKQGVRLVCVTNGLEFPSIAAAARYCNVSTTMIYHHLNNRTGCAEIRGMKFKRNFR